MKALLAMPSASVAAVCPDSSAGRLVKAAQAAGVPIVNMESMPRCDLGVAAHCQRYIPAEVRARYGLGVLAYHPSLLPRHRGRDAVHWTVAMGEPVAGGSAYWMDEGADTGPVEEQDWCHVLPGETAADLWRRELAPMGVRLLTRCVGKLAFSGQPVPINVKADTSKLLVSA